MPQVVIENPIINSPYRAPLRHFAFDNDGVLLGEYKSRTEALRAIPPLYSHRERCWR